MSKIVSDTVVSNINDHITDGEAPKQLLELQVIAWSLTGSFLWPAVNLKMLLKSHFESHSVTELTCNTETCKKKFYPFYFKAVKCYVTKKIHKAHVMYCSAE